MAELKYLAPLPDLEHGMSCSSGIAAGAGLTLICVCCLFNRAVSTAAWTAAESSWIGHASQRWGFTLINSSRCAGWSVQDRSPVCAWGTIGFCTHTLSRGAAVPHSCTLGLVASGENLGGKGRNAAGWVSQACGPACALCAYCLPSPSTELLLLL